MELILLRSAKDRDSKVTDSPFGYRRDGGTQARLAQSSSSETIYLGEIWDLGSDVLNNNIHVARFGFVIKKVGQESIEERLIVILVGLPVAGLLGGRLGHGVILEHDSI